MPFIYPENPFLIFLIVKLDWDIEEYYRECVKKGKDKKRKRFPNPIFGKKSDPLTVVDSKGRIVLWYLLELLSILQQVSGFFTSSI